jgi:hypothetical protein
MDMLSGFLAVLVTKCNVLTTRSSSICSGSSDKLEILATI